MTNGRKAGAMPRARLRTMLGLLISFSVISTPVADEDRPRQSGLIESDRVEVVEAWPFLAKAKNRKHEDACANLGPEDLQVIEGGHEARVLDVARALPLTTQILMIDASGSMMDVNRIISRKKGRQAKTAARAYVDWMVDDAVDAAAPGRSEVELIVVTFDDDLLMAVPPTIVADRRIALGLHHRIDAIVGGFYTSFYDSLLRLTGYVQGRGGRTAVIVLSDGADYGSLRSSVSAIDRIEETNNITLFPISIGDVTPHHARFMKQIAEISGGKSFELRRQKPDSLATPLEHRFAEIRARLKSLLYVSYLTEPPGALASDAKNLDDENQIRRELTIRSTDPRCAVPKDGYRSTRTLLHSEAKKTLSTSGGRGEIAAAPAPGRPATIGLASDDILLDSGPLLDSMGPRQAASLAERRLELVAPPLETDPGAPHLLRRAVERRPVDVVRDWMLDATVPVAADRAGEPPRVMNGKTFLDLRFALAEVLFHQLETYRTWLLAKVERRVRQRYLTRVPPPSDPSERERYDTALELIVQRALADVTWRDYVDDASTWLGDVRARDLALNLMANEINSLIRDGAVAKPAADRIQERWPDLHAWLYFPAAVRVLALLELSCSTERNQCGFYRIVRPRLSELPEDLSQPRGKTAAPASFEEYEVYYGAKIPRHPFGLMLFRWFLGLPVGPVEQQLTPERTRLADELRAHWRVTSIDQFPEDSSPPAEWTSEDGIWPCRRRIEVTLESADGDETPVTNLVFRVEGHVGPEQAPMDPSVFRDVCETADSVEVRFGCFERGSSQAGTPLELLLEQSGLEVCGGPQTKTTVPASGY